MSHTHKTAAIIGGGVIGGGWAARFLLSGWHVQVFDPDPEAERKINEVLFNARRALPGLYNELLPAEGNLQFASDLHQAVHEAQWIQESVPERLDIKQSVMQDIQAAAPADAVLPLPPPDSNHRSWLSSHHSRARSWLPIPTTRFTSCPSLNLFSTRHRIPASSPMLKISCMPSA